MDPITAFSAITAAAGGIKQIISAGRDLSAASNHIKAWASAEAEIDIAKRDKQSGWRAVFSGAESQAIDEHFRKREIDDLRNELRQIFLVFGKPGEWEALQAAIGQAKKEQKDRIEAERKRRAKIFEAVFLWGMVAVGVAMAIGILLVVVWGLQAKGTL